MRRGLVYACLGVLALSSACRVQPLPPIVRLEVTPLLLCAGDPSQVVTFLAEAKPPFDDSPTDFSYAWDFDPAPLELVSGGVATDSVQARFAADRPVDARLTISAGGESSHRHEIVALAAVALPSCTDASTCGSGEVCVHTGGTGMCTPDTDCLDDSYCPCLRCAQTDEGVPRCVSR